MTTKDLSKLNNLSQRMENIHAGIAIVGGWCRKAEKTSDPDKAIEYLNEAKHRLDNTIIGNGFLKDGRATSKNNE